MDNTVNVDNIDNVWNSTRNKMTILEDQVESLKRKIHELREKFSRPEPKKIGSEVPDVTLVFRDEKQISSHNIIISSNSPVLPQQKTANIAPNQSDVSLACGNDTKVYAHKTILSSSSSVSAVVKKDIEKECADITLVCGDDKQVAAHSLVLSSNSSIAKKKEVNKVNINVTLAPEDVNYQPKNTWLCRRANISMFQSSGGCQCAADEFLQQYPVASPPLPTQCQARGISRQLRDQNSRGQVLGECYYERGGNH